MATAKQRTVERGGIALALASLGISIVLLAQEFSALNVALPPQRAGLAGGAMGLGLTTTVVATTTRDALRADTTVTAALPANQVDAPRGLLAGTESAQQVVAQFDPATAQRLLANAGEAFAAGVRTGLRVDAALAALAFLVALFLIRGSRAETERRSVTSDS